MRTCLIILCFVSLPFSSRIPARAAGDDDSVPSREILRRGIESYQLALETRDRGLRTERFEIAETHFAKVIESQPGLVSPELYVNLGNAALGAEDLGTAIVAYRRALDIAPGHAKAQQNLRHARSQLPSWIPVPVESITWGSFFDWTTRLRRGDWAGIAAILFMFSMLLFAIGRKTHHRSVRWVSGLMLISWAITLGCYVLFVDSNRVEAVVIMDDVIGRSADSAGAPARLKEPLPAGVEVTVLEARDEWARIALADGREAWLRRSEIKTF